MSSVDIHSPLHFTDSAASRVSELVAKQSNDNLCLRISIKGGGCSGFQYSFKLDEPTEDDLIIENALENGRSARLIVDYVSLQYLEGATLNFSRGLQGEHFSLDNPHAKTTCGCGSSFSV